MIMVYMIGRYIRMYRDIKLPGKAGIVFVLLWFVNGLSHENPIQVGGIYHHLCKDNSITNLIMAVILLYVFKELGDFRSQKAGRDGKLTKLINKVAGYVFAVFALNNTIVTICMEQLLKVEGQSADGIIGFLELAGIVAAVLVGCLLIGVIRELLIGRLDQKLSIFVENKLSFYI